MAEELPTVIVPVPSDAPIVKAADTDDGLILTIEIFVPVAEVKVVLPRFVMPDTYKLVVEALTKTALVEVTIVPEAEVKYSGPVNVPPARGR